MLVYEIAGVFLLGKLAGISMAKYFTLLKLIFFASFYNEGFKILRISFRVLCILSISDSIEAPFQTFLQYFQYPAKPYPYYQIENYK